MRCMVCGREAMNPEANYCDYCGNSFREAGRNWQEDASAWNAYQSGTASEESGYTAFGTTEYREELRTPRKDSSQAKGVSVWMFLGIMCLQFVPGIGLFAYIGVLLWLGFSPQIADARKNWARASLIYTGIMFVLSFAYLKTLLGMLGGA